MFPNTTYINLSIIYIFFIKKILIIGSHSNSKKSILIYIYIFKIVPKSALAVGLCVEAEWAKADSA